MFINNCKEWGSYQNFDKTESEGRFSRQNGHLPVYTGILFGSSKCGSSHHLRFIADSSCIDSMVCCRVLSFHSQRLMWCWSTIWVHCSVWLLNLSHDIVRGRISTIELALLMVEAGRLATRQVRPIVILYEHYGAMLDLFYLLLFGSIDTDNHWVRAVIETSLISFSRIT